MTKNNTYILPLYLNEPREAASPPVWIGLWYTIWYTKTAQSFDNLRKDTKRKTLQALIKLNAVLRDNKIQKASINTPTLKAAGSNPVGRTKQKPLRTLDFLAVFLYGFKLNSAVFIWVSTVLSHFLSHSQLNNRRLSLVASMFFEHFACHIRCHVKCGTASLEYMPASCFPAEHIFSFCMCA